MSVQLPRSARDATDRSIRSTVRRMRRSRSGTVALLAVAFVTAGCSDEYKALGTHTARIFINGSDTGEQPRVRCEQVQWVWFIETLRDNPGFKAQVRTGEAAQARAVQIENLGGFTGSFWDGTVGNAQAGVTDGTIIIAGTAKGYYHADPSETVTATFEIRTDC